MGEGDKNKMGLILRCKPSRKLHAQLHHLHRATRHGTESGEQKRQQRPQHACATESLQGPPIERNHGDGDADSCANSVLRRAATSFELH